MSIEDSELDVLSHRWQHQYGHDPYTRIDTRVLSPALVSS